MYRLRRTICLFLLLLVTCVAADAQKEKKKAKFEPAPVNAVSDSTYMDETFRTLMSMTAEDYLSMELPSLNELFANARNSWQVTMLDSSIEIARRDVLTARRQWASWLRVFAGYTYGNTDMTAVQYMETTFPVWNMATSTQSQSYYNAGVTLFIPLDGIINYRNKIKQQESRMEYAERQREAQFDIVKKDIVRYYTAILEKRSVLKVAAEGVVSAEAQYTASEIDFMNNRMNAQELYQRKSYVVVAIREYESIRAELNEALLSLEIASCTKILPRKQD